MKNTAKPLTLIMVRESKSESVLSEEQSAGSGNRPASLLKGFNVVSLTLNMHLSRWWIACAGSQGDSGEVSLKLLLPGHSEM